MPANAIVTPIHSSCCIIIIFFYLRRLWKGCIGIVLVMEYKEKKSFISPPNDHIAANINNHLIIIYLWLMDGLDIKII